MSGLTARLKRTMAIIDHHLSITIMEDPQNAIGIVILYTVVPGAMYAPRTEELLLSLLESHVVSKEKDYSGMGTSKIQTDFQSKDAIIACVHGHISEIQADIVAS